MRVLLTGAAGFLGSYTVEELIHAGHSVLGLVRPQTDRWRLADIGDKCGIRQLKLTGSTDLLECCSSFQPEAIVHCAWENISQRHKTDYKNDPEQFRNLQLLTQLMTVAHDVGARRMIAFGSQAEYGNLSGPAKEDHPLNPTTMYGASKVSCWFLGKQLAASYGMRFAWLRIFSLYGPKDNETLMVPSVISTFLRGQSPKITSGEQTWDYLHVRDCARAAVRAVETDEAEGAYNIGSGEPHKIREVVEMLQSLSGSQTEPEFGAVAFEKHQVMRLQADISAFRKTTGWHPTISLEEGLRETIEYYRSRKLN